MSKTVNIKDISTEMLRQLWLSEQLTYNEYITELARRDRAEKIDD